MHVRSPTEGAYYLSAGLANGKLAIYDQYMLQVCMCMHDTYNIRKMFNTPCTV